MLQQIRIQNFKSLKDVTLDLQQVNLLIGPNNSGKSNLLKALEFLGKWFEGKAPEKEELKRLKFQQSDNTIIVRIENKFYNQKGETFFDLYNLEIKEYNNNEQIVYSESIEGDDVFLNLDLKKESQSKYTYRYKTGYGFSGNKTKLQRIDLSPGDVIQNVPSNSFIQSLVKTFTSLVVYKPDPNTFSHSSPLGVDLKVNSSASNLVSFLDNIKEENPSTFKQIETDLHRCVPEFTNITLPKTKAEKGYIEKKIRLLGSDGLTYWADEVSEGVLYFLALLCIIHQPNPPKLLLLEEPDKGIHPRRIKEVMRFIFQLAEEKGIQVILTSHSVHVVDEFAYSPESVFVFDKDEEGATNVKNLQKDIIEPSHKRSEEAGVAKISFTETLGDHWVMGFLGGVPE